MKNLPEICTKAWGTVNENPFKISDKLKYQEDVYFYVIRRYSGITRPKHLFQVESRRFSRYLDAVDWQDFMKSQKKGIYQIIAIPESDEVLA